MFRSALIALVVFSTIGTSVSDVPLKNENKISLSLATNKTIPLKVTKEKKSFALKLNTKLASAISVKRAAKVKIKPGRSNNDIAQAKKKAQSARKVAYVPTRPVNGNIPSDAAYKKWLTAAAAKYGVSNQVYALYRVMMGESGGNPYAQNASGASGLFQFMPSTWRGTPYGGCSIWDAKSQCYAAAWMFSQGRQREWVVYNMYF